MPLRDAADIIGEMRVVVGGPNIAGAPAGWSADASHPDQLVLLVPLETTMASIATARLIFRARRQRPDRDCSATLVLTYRGRDFCAWRFDWRPATAHRNKLGGAGVRGRDVETGVHDFEPNAALGLEQMQADNLPICLPAEEPHNFDAFVRAACGRLSLTLTEPILSPPWSPRLF